MEVKRCYHHQPHKKTIPFVKLPSFNGDSDGFPMSSSWMFVEDGAEA